jgi:hypothetical protein
MSSVVCTLFEKDYHHGLAVLVNSLVRNGFEGTVVAGYRGPLPPWAAGVASVAGTGQKERRVLQVATGVTVEFRALETRAHFTNYKPDFMLQILGDPGLKPDLLFYLDPDIVLAVPWRFLREWASCGIALCEDVNSPLMSEHPRRVGWRRFFAQHGVDLEFRHREYVNGGCVGLSSADRPFLEMWRQLLGLVTDTVGGATAAKVEGGGVFVDKGFASCFDCSDQDALNAAIEACPDRRYSILPRSAMGFESGALVLPHAIGGLKPWRRRYLRDALLGRIPGPADKAYWRYADAPIRSMSGPRRRLRAGAQRIASAVGRVYRRA